MKCIKVLVHQQPYKEILWSFGLEELFSLRWSSSSWFLLWLDLSLWLPLWKSSCLITLEIWSLVLNLVFLSSKSRLTKPWFHRHVRNTFQNHYQTHSKSQVFIWNLSNEMSWQVFIIRTNLESVVIAYTCHNKWYSNMFVQFL